MGGAYDTSKCDAKRAINMGTRLSLKIHKRGEVSIKPGRHVFVLKVGTEERKMDFFKRYAGGKRY